MNIFLVRGTHCFEVQHANTRLASPPSHAEAEGMLLRSLCLKLELDLNNPVNNNSITMDIPGNKNNLFSVSLKWFTILPLGAPLTRIIQSDLGCGKALSHWSLCIAGQPNLSQCDGLQMCVPMCLICGHLCSFFLMRVSTILWYFCVRSVYHWVYS